MDQIDKLFSGLPDGWANYISALAVLIVGLLIAYIAKAIVAGAINRTGFAKKAQTTGGNIGNSIGKAVFWILVLYTLYFALSRLNMTEALQPIDNLLSDIANFLPNLIGAGLIGFIGYIVARVAKNATTATLDAAQIDSLATKTGLSTASGSQGSLSRTLGTIVFVLIIIPVAIAALGALQIDEISIPLTSMLQGFLDYIPELIGASAILAATIFIGKWISGVIANILPTFGFDKSINEIMMLDDGEGLKSPPSKTAGFLAFLIILVIGISAAVNVLNNESLSDAFSAVQQFGGEILKAAVLIIIGVFLANFVGRFMSSIVSPKIANIVKYSAMVLFVFLGLSQLDAEGQIIPRAFELMLGAAAVAAGVGGAVAFGLGGREWAGKKLQEWMPNKTASRARKK